MENSQTSTGLPHWDMTVIYPGLESPEFQQAFDSAIANIAELEALFDKHEVRRREQPTPVDAATVQAVEEIITRLNAVLEQAGTVSAYISSFVATNSRDALAQ